jgi:hypothetical protein
MADDGETVVLRVSGCELGDFNGGYQESGHCNGKQQYKNQKSE